MVLDLDVTCVDAWRVLADVYQARGDWQGVEAATTRLIEMSERPSFVERQARIRARLELGDVAGATADMELLAHFLNKRVQNALPVFQAMLLLRQGRDKEALAAAGKYLQKTQRVRYKEALAVRFEAAHRLGKPGKAGKLTNKDIARLRERGYGAWMDRLIANYGAGKKGQ